MGNQVLDSSESESDSDSAPVAKCSSTTASRQTPPTPRLTVDFSASTPKATRVIKTTQKQKENDDRANTAKDAEIEALRKQVQTLKKKHEKSKSPRTRRQSCPLESEEEDDEPVDMSSFSSSFVSKGVVGRKPPKTAPKKLRSGKAGETPIATPMPHLALTNLEDDLNDVHDQPTSDGAASDGAEDPNLDASIDTPSSDPRPHVRQKRARSSSPHAKRSKKKKKVEGEVGGRRDRRAVVVEVVEGGPSDREGNKAGWVFPMFGGNGLGGSEWSGVTNRSRKIWGTIWVGASGRGDDKFVPEVFRERRWLCQHRFCIMRVELACGIVLGATQPSQHSRPWYSLSGSQWHSNAATNLSYVGTQQVLLELKSTGTQDTMELE
ncbi:hypothetical protein B0H13DRAFT_1884082 [Mycena leptocephala]|nr:hypothetical protein B0H13DRAFT_1884082 [Mycena leptocephala]